MRGGATAGLLLIVLLPTSPAYAQPTPLPARGDRPAAAQLANRSEVRARLGLLPAYDGVAGVEAIKIAVLDFGFDGLGRGLPYLPESAEVVEHYDAGFVARYGLGDPAYRKGFEPGNRHGRVIAQIVWATTGAHPGGPKFYLLNANGPTMLRRAVRFAIDKKVDLILFCGSFEGGGNGDGRGPINRIVDDALAAGILWVNAAGNYGGRVYNGFVQVLGDGYLRLRSGSDVAALRFRNHVDENTVCVTLTWNDYRDREDAGTDQDLDFYVEDWAGRRVGAGAKRQVAGDRVPGPDETRNPRERLVLNNLAASPERTTDPDYCYRIRIQRRRGTFTPADRIRVLVTSTREAYLPPGANAPRPALDFVDASGSGEIYPPADHPLVLTVGDAEASSSIGPTADGRVKPDVMVEDSRAFFSDGEISVGSSNAAAYVAGAVAVLKAAAPDLRPIDLIELARKGPAAPAALAESRSPRPPGQAARGLHLWQTPTRARLDERIRGRR